MTPLPVRHVSPSRVVEWLRLGVHDLVRAPGPGIMHGALVTLGGIAIAFVANGHWMLLSGALSGFVLVAPIIATGLYETSRLLSRGEPATLRTAIDAWRRGTRPLVWLGVWLGIVGTLWVAFSAAMFALFVRTPIADAASFLRYVAAIQGDFLFLLWLILGGLGAAVVFAATAVSPPLLLGRVIGLRAAVLTSVRAVGENPATMALWALVIMVASALSMATFMLGFVVAIPILGHATWHAYRELVDTSSVPLRN
jgi:uncharacterized membrane protein